MGTFLCQHSSTVGQRSSNSEDFGTIVPQELVECSPRPQDKEDDADDHRKGHVLPQQRLRSDSVMSRLLLGAMSTCAQAYW